MPIGKILYVNLKHNFMVHLAIAIIIALLTPLVFSISSLDEKASYQPIEMLLPFIGTILLTPVFLPEQNEEIRDVIRSKKTDYLAVCVIRVIYSIASILLITAAFIIVMRYHECAVTWKHLVGSFASSLFMGTVGIVIAGLSKNAAAGYMGCMVYYAANIGLKNKLGFCFLFSMYSDGEILDKFLLILLSLICIAILFVILKKRFHSVLI